jgi:hypothetical protein
MDKTKCNEEEYGIDFLARFACLYEGINLSCQHAERIGYNTEISNVWIKPGALQKYVEERYGDMKFSMQQEQRGITVDEIYPWDQVYK